MRLPVIQIPWAFKCKGTLPTAWMGNALPVFGYPRWRAGVSKAFFFLLQLLWLLSPEDLMFWPQSILWQNAKDTEMLNSMAGSSRRPSLLSFHFHSTIYTNWYRWFTGQTKEGGKVQNRWWRLKKCHFPNNFIIIATVSTPPRASDHSTQNRNGSQWTPGFLNPEVSLQTTTRMTGNGICVLN